MTANINTYIVFVRASELSLYECMTDVKAMEKVRKSWQQDLVKRSGLPVLKYYQDHFGLEVFE